MSMVPDDHAALLRMLGRETVPADVEAEYAVRIQMFHRSGRQGPLGEVGLIDVCRKLGYSPPADPVQASIADWRKYPQDGSTRVEAHFFGDWQAGTFLGFVQAGTLAVRLDVDGTVKECRPHMVRLVGVVAQGKQDEEPDVRAALLELERHEKLRQPPELAPLPTLADEPRSPAPEGVVEVEDLEFESAEGDLGPDDEPLASGKWSDVPTGAKVWVETDGDIKDGRLVATDGEKVVVHVEGEAEPREFLEGVHLAG